MKYFENLPKTNFTSTIGNFSISNFFTYIDVNSIFLEKDNILVDTQTTLLESASKYYQDPNSFWMFLTSNNAINPFDLLSVNVGIFFEENANKLDIEIVGNTAGTTGYVFQKGSLILPFKNNTGNSASYDSVGNFDLNGPLSIIESVSYYDGNMIIKDQRGATYSFITPTGTAGSSIVILTQTAGGTYTIQKPYYPYNSKPAYESIVRVEFSEEKLIDEKSGKAVYYKEAPESTISVTGGSEITALTAIESQNKNIQAFIPNEIGILKNYFVTTKYI